MTVTTGIINQGNGSWAFEEHAERLASALWLEIVDRPRDRNFVLGWERKTPPSGDLFIPWEGIHFASDKRLQAEAFNRAGVPMPATVLLDNLAAVRTFLATNDSKRWVLKYPTSCGASGHRFLNLETTIPADWPTPFVVQEFIESPQPEVYRLYGVAGELFGWNARRFPAGVKPSPWVAHARGARYCHLAAAPKAAMDAAKGALSVAGLMQSFGAVDLLSDGRGWLVLEVGTDGVHNHVDRDFENPSLEAELNRRLAEAFWHFTADKPWGRFGWRPRHNVGAALTQN